MSAPLNAPIRLMLDIPKWQAETSGLTTTEKGALLQLKMHFWRSGPLADRDSSLAAITGLSSTEWKRARKSLEPLFSVSYGEWVHPDWADELEAAYATIKARSDAGNAAVNRRWSKKRQRESDTIGIPNVHHLNTKYKGNVKTEEPTPTPPSQETNFLDGDDGSFEYAVRIAERDLGIGGGL